LKKIHYAKKIFFKNTDIPRTTGFSTRGIRRRGPHQIGLSNTFSLPWCSI